MMRAIRRAVFELFAFFGVDASKEVGFALANRRGRVYGGGSRAYSGPRPCRVDYRPMRLKGELVGVPFAVRGPRRRVEMAEVSAYRKRKLALEEERTQRLTAGRKARIQRLHTAFAV